MSTTQKNTANIKPIHTCCSWIQYDLDKHHRLVPVDLPVRPRRLHLGGEQHLRGRGHVPEGQARQNGRRRIHELEVGLDRRRPRVDDGVDGVVRVVDCEDDAVLDVVVALVQGVVGGVEAVGEGGAGRGALSWRNNKLSKFHFKHDLSIAHFYKFSG